MNEKARAADVWIGRYGFFLNFLVFFFYFDRIMLSFYFDRVIHSFNSFSCFDGLCFAFLFGMKY